MTTVLVIDDHAAFRAQARALLTAEGYDVIGEAIDATSGVAAALRLRPDLVLLDIGLPDTDGFEVADQLAVEEPRPMVVLTSSREAADFGRRLTTSHILGFIPKEELSGAAIRALVPAP